MKSCFRMSVLCLCMAFATHSLAGFEGREILRRPDMCNVDTVDTVAWYAQESVRLEVEPWRCGKRVEIPEGATAAWVVADEGGTNWLVRYDAAPSSNRCAFALAAGEGNLPSGHDYTGYVSLLSGTNILGVLDRHEVAVMGQAADGGAEISPEGGCWGSLLERMAEAERGIQGLAQDVATNALYIAELEEDVAALEAATNALDAADAALDSRIDSLWGECAGGFRWPNYFAVNGYETGVLPGTITNGATATQEVCNVIVETVEEARLKGWRIDEDIYRQSDWSTGVVWKAVEAIRRTNYHGLIRYKASIDPADLVVEGNVVHFAEGVESVESDFAAVRGTLGDFTVTQALEFDASKQSTTSTVHRFAGPAPGSLLAACWSNVLGAASNGVGSKGVSLRTWPEGYGSGTNHVAAGWNADFWGAGLGDFSCVSYHTDYSPWGPGGVYQPLTMVTPRHAVAATHFKPTQGSNVYWVSRSGAILTNKVISYKTVRGDLTVARLDHAFDTNDIAPAKLLGSGWHSYLYGSTNFPNGLFGVPVVGFDCAERGYVMSWLPSALLYGRRDKGQKDDSDGGVGGYGGGDPFEGVVPFYRGEAVGGDSGSPVFWPVDGETVLLWCWYTAGGGPLPTKEEVDEAIAAWGDGERCETYGLQDGGWPNPDAPPPVQ